jgi:hypothetical protein
VRTPLLSSNTDAEREAELTRLNGKLYTVAKVQSDKSCPLIANRWLSETERGIGRGLFAHPASAQIERP